MSTVHAAPPTYSLVGDPLAFVTLSSAVEAAESNSGSGPAADAEGGRGEQRWRAAVNAARPISSISAIQAPISEFPDYKLLDPPAPRLCFSRISSFSSLGAQPKLKPTNYVSLFRKTHKRARWLGRFGSASIKGTYAVDPFLDIPASLLAPLPLGETTRKNLVLKVEDGAIDVDVHLTGEPTPTTTVAVERTELHLELCGARHNAFPLIAKIHTSTLRRPPFRVSFVARNGFVTLHLPPSFHGLLTVRVGAGDLTGRITLSAAMTAHATIFSEDGTSRSYFIGALGGGRWDGDVAEVSVERGRVRVLFSGGEEPGNQEK